MAPPFGEDDGELSRSTSGPAVDFSPTVVLFDASEASPAGGPGKSPKRQSELEWFRP